VGIKAKPGSKKYQRPRVEPVWPDGMPRDWCSKCGSWKFIWEFARMNQNSTSMIKPCQLCFNKWAREYNQRRPLKPCATPGCKNLIRVCKGRICSSCRWRKSPRTNWQRANVRRRKQALVDWALGYAKRPLKLHYDISTPEKQLWAMRHQFLVKCNVLRLIRQGHYSGHGLNHV
jgi:hypothetical protein